jgi:hypothetical protein
MIIWSDYAEKKFAYSLSDTPPAALPIFLTHRRSFLILLIAGERTPLPPCRVGAPPPTERRRGLDDLP